MTGFRAVEVPLGKGVDFAGIWMELWRYSGVRRERPGIEYLFFTRGIRIKIPAITINTFLIRLTRRTSGGSEAAFGSRGKS